MKINGFIGDVSSKRVNITNENKNNTAPAPKFSN